MMPILKNNYDVYGTCKKRRESDKSQNRSSKLSQNSATDGPSLSTSPSNESCSPPYRNLHHVMSVPSSKQHFSRASSQNSRSSQSIANSPSKSGSHNSLNKFQNKVFDQIRKTFKRSSSNEHS